MCREAAHRQNNSSAPKKRAKHAVIKMVEPTHRSPLTGEGFNRGEAELMSTLKKYFANKPPKGAVVKSPREIGAGYGAECLGKRRYQECCQVRIMEMN